MIRFSALVERLIFTPGRNGKLRLLEAYFRDAPDPDRGWAVAALTGALTDIAAELTSSEGVVLSRARHLRHVRDGLDGGAAGTEGV